MCCKVCKHVTFLFISSYVSNINLKCIFSFQRRKENNYKEYWLSLIKNDEVDEARLCTFRNIKRKYMSLEKFLIFMEVYFVYRLTSLKISTYEISFFVLQYKSPIKNILLTWKTAVNLDQAFESKWGNIENKFGIWTLLYNDKLSNFITKYWARQKHVASIFLQPSMT